MTDTQAPQAAMLICSFCRLSQKQVKKLIAGPDGVCICNECVDLCADIISEDSEDDAPSEEQLAAAWAGMLKNRARAAKTAEADLEKLVRQARAKGLDWSQIGLSLGISAHDAKGRFGSEQ